MGDPAVLEIDVEMTCRSCAQTLHDALETLEHVKIIDINGEKQQVLVETSLPSYDVIRAIERTGKRAVLKGYGPTLDRQNLGAAVAEVMGKAVGVVRFVQTEPGTCLIDGTIDGLMPGQHGIHIHEFGDLSRGCDSVGSHYNPTDSVHGAPEDMERHYGDLGNIGADSSGRAKFRKIDNIIKVWDVIGRSLVITENADDLGQGNSKASRIDGNSGPSVACGIIARSAGLFQNPKRFCQCDGVAIWDERDNPVAGESRGNQKNHEAKL